MGLRQNIHFSNTLSIKKDNSAVVAMNEITHNHWRLRSI